MDRRLRRPALRRQRPGTAAVESASGSGNLGFVHEVQFSIIEERKPWGCQIYCHAGDPESGLAYLGDEGFVAPWKERNRRGVTFSCPLFDGWLVTPRAQP